MDWKTWVLGGVAILLAYLWRNATERAAKLEAKLRVLGVDPDATLPAPLQGQADELAIAKLGDEMGYSREEAEGALR